MGQMGTGLVMVSKTDRHRTRDEWWDRWTLGLEMEGLTDGLRNESWDR